MTQAVTLLKLLLQKMELVSSDMAPLLFSENEQMMDEDVSIAELKQKFENLGVPTKKSI